MLVETLMVLSGLFAIILLFIKEKSTFYNFLSVILILFTVIMGFYNNYEPIKEIEIDIARTFSLDQYKNWDLDEATLYLFQGCEMRAMNFLHNFEISNDNNEEDYLFMHNYYGDKWCINCTYFSIAIFNPGKDFDNSVIFSINTTDKFNFLVSDSKIEIFDQKKIDQNYEFLVKIHGGIKGEKSEILYLKGYTDNYVNLDISCDLIKKSECSIIKYNQGLINNQDYIEKFFSDMNIQKPKYLVNELSVYEFYSSENNFHKLNTKIENIYFKSGICKEDINGKNPYLKTYD